ncbi:complex III assembly factor LYRM7 [Arctopsyche grandis]|uniref:complex III assembly factor LYRM7 n=1 Tax=Arctopsyche grandis TaxID=121162 RepID=UPI00406D761E
MTLRNQVLNCFKKLHKARKLIFNGDDRALQMTRFQINDEFNKNKSIDDDAKIKELVEFGLAVEYELKTTVIQAKEVKPGVYEAKINPETRKLDNVMFNEELVESLDVGTDKKKCCKEYDVK